MESLYALTINGSMLYIKGNLSEQDCKNIDIIAKHFLTTNNSLTSQEEICQSFIKKVHQSLNISLVEVSLNYIFRIK